ncbi:hypothetical protein AQ730_31830 [Burkholderia pseudomallei]|nr:hypothetical protein BOC36_21565 [Burkholderia pseudomallei]ARK70617.1 hypothetical protein BOC38_29120 [Burkholderia pseudomallei]ARK91615.1 hypothetical protein BOC42_31260 [Burkholderia pseudomallei]ARL06431.1 hypothetical protein BOC44_33905 [Burkholderia pseudomallei]ARL39512.1 hypothetical protein BOC49_25490 [Burkholderia pseudomallei]
MASEEPVRQARRELAQARGAPRAGAGPARIGRVGARASGARRVISPAIFFPHLAGVRPAFIRRSFDVHSTFIRRSRRRVPRARPRRRPPRARRGLNGS